LSPPLSYTQVENEEYQLKPMNCPFHVAMYKDGYFSYRDLPKRWAELGTVYRCGEMHMGQPAAVVNTTVSVPVLMLLEMTVMHAAESVLQQ
jgi:hypothetical protein